jgi:hypothetical protein
MRQYLKISGTVQPRPKQPPTFPLQRHLSSRKAADRKGLHHKIVANPSGRGSIPDNKHTTHEHGVVMKMVCNRSPGAVYLSRETRLSPLTTGGDN